MDINNYAEKMGIALQQKQNENYKKAIQIELAKADWQNRKFEIEKLLAGIKESTDFEKYQKTLIKLFDDLYEVITAPGVDSFIGWINSITEYKNETNTKKLRSFLVENFSETKISGALDSILSNKDFFNIENSIFSTLINEISKQIKNGCNEFINKPDEFKNGVDGFLDLLNRRLIDFNNTLEFKYIAQKELYSSTQVENNIEWYDEVVEQIISLNQSLKPTDKSEEDSGPAPGTKAKRRIADIKACIQTLDDLGIANYSDEILKKIFLRFVIESIKFEGGIKDNLDEFIESKWSEIESNYNIINEFFTETKEIEYNPLWNVYPQNDEIQALILNHKSIIKENPLLMIQSQKSTLGILQTLTKKVKAINEFNQLADRIKTDILDLFIKTITEYEDKNLLLLESLANSNSSLHSIIETINEQLEGLKNGKNALEKVSDLLPYLSESFTYDLNSYTEISNLFTKALQESGKSNHLKWLELKLNGTDQGVLTVDDFKNPDLVKELLSIGLIKINIEKQF